MGLLDKAKEKLSENKDQAEQGIDKGRDFVDERTEGKYSDQLNTGRDRAKENLGRLSDNA